ncbi:hypothetical protein HAP47_0016610 [Bradyrhizobium sp. 41S5]|uniref:hypothetical protein n=1 Tax=Bradyrhizobium sp. 41S5 TaxID=1404443 RepID=UPI00156BA3AD|nr:hypothetical protein [Bradyrhizobium sp. 41S5]UFX48191.1 hypothetical protein HAP47_0016610 [Bradyrhizobium sp. 41S5]
MKLANQKEHRRDRRLVRNQNGKGKVIVIVQARDGNSVPAVFQFAASKAASLSRARRVSLMAGSSMMMLRRGKTASAAKQVTTASRDEEQVARAHTRKYCMSAFEK